MEKAELKVRLSSENLDFVEQYAAARRLTAAKVIDLSLSHLREKEMPTLRRGAESNPYQVPDDVRASFDKLAQEWRTQTRYHSSLTEMVTHPAYQRIIGMGADAIPLMLQELVREPNHWFWALKSISGEDPVPDEIRGDIEAMSRAWLDWGQQHGYC